MYDANSSSQKNSVIDREELLRILKNGSLNEIDELFLPFEDVFNPSMNLLKGLEELESAFLDLNVKGWYLNRLLYCKVKMLHSLSKKRELPIAIVFDVFQRIDQNSLEFKKCKELKLLLFNDLMDDYCNDGGMNSLFNGLVSFIAQLTKKDTETIIRAAKRYVDNRGVDYLPSF